MDKQKYGRGLRPELVLMDDYGFLHKHAEALDKLPGTVKMLRILLEDSILVIGNPFLQNVDPFDKNLTDDQKLAIVVECKTNPLYYIKKILGNDKLKKLNSTSSLRTYISEKNHLLTYVGEPIDKPILTGELYQKWYSLYLLNPDGNIEKHIPDIDEVSFRDESYNPEELSEYCEKHNFALDPIVEEMNYARWHDK